MVRRIIEIDSEKCNGCGLCAEACHEGAIGMVDGKAVLLRDDYCDGLGDCLPVCPVDAIQFVEREALAYDDEAVQAHMKKRGVTPPKGGCPGTQAKQLHRRENLDEKMHENKQTQMAGGCPGSQAQTFFSEEKAGVQQAGATVPAVPSMLNQWPVQLKLVPVNAPYFEGANLLIAADCAAYSYGNFHADYMKNKVTVIGCPKLDQGDYSEKLTAILQHNNIKSVHVVRMEVPCCGGLEGAAIHALQNCGKMIPWQVTTFSIDGKVLEQ